MEPDIDIGDSGITMLTSAKDADAKLKENGPLMMIYYAKWCGHCQHSFEDWKQLSKKQKGKIFMIESANYPNITSFPTIKIVKDGKVSPYEGERTLADMEKALLTGKKGGLRSRLRSRRGRGSARKLRGRVRKTHRALRRNVTFV